jgi:hypothetical protein
VAPSERARNGRSGRRCQDLWLMTIKHILGDLISYQKTRKGRAVIADNVSKS